jgi:hypothetical protein
MLYVMSIFPHVNNLKWKGKGYGVSLHKSICRIIGIIGGISKTREPISWALFLSRTPAPAVSPAARLKYGERPSAYEKENTISI